MFYVCACVCVQSKMAPLQACLKEAGDCRTRDDFENHTKAIGEAMGEHLAFFYRPLAITRTVLESKTLPRTRSTPSCLSR